MIRFLKKCFIVIVVSLVTTLVSACESAKDISDDPKKPGKENEFMETSAEFDIFFDRNNEENNDNVSRIFYESETMIDNIETDKDGSLYLLRVDELGKTIFETVRDAEIDSVPVDAYCRCLCLDDVSNVFCTYNISDSRIEVRNKRFEYIKTLLADFYPFEVKEMIVRNNNLYVLLVSQNPFEMKEDSYIEEMDGYVDYGEKLLKVSLESGEYEYLDINNIITMCESDNQYIYLYTHRNDSFQIDVYDTSSESIVYSLDVEKLGYVFSMGVFGADIFYISADSAGVCRYNVKSGETRCLIPEVIVVGQSDFDVCGRYLVVLNRINWTISTVDTVSGKVSNSNNTSVGVENDAEVLIGAVDLYSIPVPLKDISENSGIQINTMISPDAGNFEFNEELLMKLMAGDPEVDIFVLSTTEPYSKKIANDGVCYPLNCSEKIVDENNAFFENISNRFKTSSGAIWGIPLNSYMEIMVASKENMEKNNISSEIFDDYQTFIYTLKNIDNKGGIFVDGYDYGFALISDYITNKHTDFGIEIFKDFFENIWGGWKLYYPDGFANNPYLGEAEDRTITAYENKALIDASTTLFHMVAANELLFNDGWSDDFNIYGLPLLDKTDKQCISLHQVAVINPYSKNKDNAVKVLETISDYLHDNGSLGVVYKDRSRYSSIIDTESKLFNSLYNLTEEALVTVHGITNDVIINEVEAYQNGDIDLDTAISSIQRKEDIYLNE
jgi:hypothetical protein